MAHDTPEGRDEKDRRTGVDDGTDGRIERRSFLQLAGATSVAGAAVLSSGTADAAEKRHGISFDSVVDAVADLGMDDTGQQAIDGALSEAASDGTLVVFPPGKYRVTQQLTLNDVSNFGIVGSSSNRGDVEFVTESGSAFQWIVADGGSNHLYENFTMQQTRDETTSFSCVLKLSTGLHVENVELAGWNPRDDKYDTKPGIRPQITSRDGVGVLKKFVCTGGGVVDTYPARRVPIWMGPSHKGELRVVECNVEESGSHAIYASRTNGCIRVEGGLFRNNDNTNMRIASGHPDKLSWVRGAEIVIDTDNAKHLPDGESYQQTRGIRVESGFQGHSGLLVEDCDIVAKSTPNSAGLITVHRTHGAVTVRNTRIRNEVDGVPFVNAKEPNTGDVDAPYGVTLQNVSVTGAAADTNAAVRISGRDESVVEKSCVQRENRAGVKIVNSEDCAVRDTNINVPDQATIFENSSVATSNVTHGDSCPLPSFDGTSGGSTGGSDSGSGGSNSGTDGSDSGTGGSGSGSDGSDSGSGDDASLDHTLDVSGGGAGTVVEYAFSVDGELAGVDVDQEDSVSGTIGQGAVAGGTDTYAFSGSITDFSASGDVTVTVDGTTVDRAKWGSDSSLDRTLKVVGTGVVTNYEFAVSGDLSGADGSIESWDDLSGSTANGYVTEQSDVDRFSFGGEVTDFTVHEGEATVYVDGSKVDPATLGSGDGSGGSTDLPHTLEVSGSDASTASEYAITVDGEMAGADLNADDGVSGATARGTVVGGTDTYAFSGSITDVSAGGDVSVAVDGETVDVRRWTLPNTLAFDGTGTGTDYSFTVTGAVVDDATGGPLESDDAVDGGSVEGSVTDDVDAFRFSGNLTSLLLDGDAAIEFEDVDG